MTNAQLKVLAVDDEKLVLDFINRFLTRKGFRVQAASNAAEALNFLEETTPDIILMDITMPGVDGYELARRITANDACRDIPIIFLSGHDVDWDAGVSFASGGALYIKKPFDGETLMETMKALVSTKME